MPVRAREFRFAVELGADGVLVEENGVALEMPDEWSPEHLLLAALVRCSLNSLGFHAGRGGFEVRAASGSGRALVTKREPAERYSVVEAEVELAVTIEPDPEAEALADLLAKAERDCFIGASLAAKPRYGWVVNGRTIGA